MAAPCPPDYLQFNCQALSTAVQTLPYWTLCIHPSSVILVFCSSIPKSLQTGKRTSSIFLISSLECSSAPLPTPNPTGHSRLILGFTPSRSQVALLHADLGVFFRAPSAPVLVSFETHYCLFTSSLLHARLETPSKQVTCGGHIPGCRTQQFKPAGGKFPHQPGPFLLLAACTLLGVDPQVPSTQEATGCGHLVVG